MQETSCCLKRSKISWKISLFFFLINEEKQTSASTCCPHAGLYLSASFALCLFSVVTVVDSDALPVESRQQLPHVTSGPNYLQDYCVKTKHSKHMLFEAYVMLHIKYCLFFLFSFLQKILQAEKKNSLFSYYSGLFELCLFFWWGERNGKNLELLCRMWQNEMKEETNRVQFKGSRDKITAAIIKEWKSLIRLLSAVRLGGGRRNPNTRAQKSTS